MEQDGPSPDEEHIQIPPIPEGTAESPLLAFLALFGVNPNNPTEVAREDPNNRGSRS